jgi:hypothetical protein
MTVRAKYVSVQVASARGVADRWKAQYQHPKDGWSTTAYGDSKAVYEKLCALGTNPDIEKAAEAIGNKSWSYISCDGCGNYETRAVSIGEYEPKSYCKTCIQEAFGALNEIGAS